MQLTLQTSCQVDKKYHLEMKWRQKSQLISCSKMYDYREKKVMAKNL